MLLDSYRLSSLFWAISIHKPKSIQSENQMSLLQRNKAKSQVPKTTKPPKQFFTKKENASTPNPKVLEVKNRLSLAQENKAKS